MRTFVLDARWALGDTICSSALARDFKATYGDSHQLAVVGHYQSVWDNNPNVVRRRLDRLTGSIQKVQLEYSQGIEASHSGRSPHFLAWLYRDFEQKTNLHVPVLQPKGDLYLTDTEKQRRIAGKYWLVVAGHKTDITVKQWPHQRYQEVIDRLRIYGLSFVQVGSTASQHVHHALRGVTDLVGKTESPRDLFSLIYNAEGVLCGVTAAMHIAAVFDKPCVVIGGGRELPAWEAYTNEYNNFGQSCRPVAVEHRFLHTIGRLDCCADRGCWRRWLVPPTEQRYAARYKGDQLRKRLCRRPVTVEELAPECMALISVDQVVDAVMSYYGPGGLPAPEGESEPVMRLDLPQALPAPRRIQATVPSILDNPILGGRLTVCVLCYGDYFKLAKRCLAGILRTIPPERLDLRIAMNACCDATRAYVNRLPATVIYDHAVNIFKGPAMRQLFHDPAHPITTPYTVWFDDDSYVLRDDCWEELGRSIVANHPRGARLYGIKFRHDLKMFSKGSHRPDLWFRQASWWRDRPFYLSNTDTTAPNGSSILFVAGGFLALATEVIHKADIPDVRLAHNGIDIVLGATTTQAGYIIQDFNRGKTHVFSSGHERRGASQRFPWANP